jgi:hypothetical protein
MLLRVAKHPHHHPQQPNQLEFHCHTPLFENRNIHECHPLISVKQISVIGVIELINLTYPSLFT